LSTETLASRVSGLAYEDSPCIRTVVYWTRRVSGLAVYQDSPCISTRTVRIRTPGVLDLLVRYAMFWQSHPDGKPING
jgi:hypothetical protein